MSQVITAEVKNNDGTTFRQIIKPNAKFFKDDPHQLCKDMFQDALVSVNKPVEQPIKEVKKDLEDIIVK